MRLKSMEKCTIQEGGGGQQKEDIEKLIKLGRVKPRVIRLDLLNILMISYKPIDNLWMDSRQTIQYM